MKQILVVPPPRPGGGPSNAVLRCAEAMIRLGVRTTSNLFSRWQSALLNVGLGIRFDALRMVKLGRRIVYRADGCYVREIFDREGNPWQPEYSQTNSRIKTALESCDHVIYQSQFSKQHLDQLVARPPGTFSIIHNGVNLDIFTPSQRTPSPVPVIGCIGTWRLNRVRTIADIAKRIPFRHKLLLVGRMDEQCRQDLTEFRQASGNCDVEYISPVYTDMELAEWHRRIDCFLHPILSDWCPNAVAEALACGTPVIVTQATGGSELVKGGGISVNVPRWIDYAAFVSSFAEAVVTILENWPMYSAKARQRAVQALDVNMMAREYLRALVPG